MKMMRMRMIMTLDLIFNTLFVPSLAFVSIDAVLLYLRNDGQVLDMLGTLFLHNSGIFFVNYVLQRAFLGTAVSLLRLSEAVRFAWEKSRAITPAEHVEAVEAWPFFTGTQAAIQISMLTIVLTFSTVVPVILPIGALYMWMQHIVDKYSLLYVRPRIKGRGSIARTCTHATLSCLIIYQAAMAGFFIVRGTKLQSSCVLILLMFTYILSLWWYIRDKQRAYHRIAQHQREQQKREEIDRELIEASRQAGLKKNEKSFLLIGETTATFTDLENAKGNQQNAELYREPALRKRHFGVLNEYGTLHQRISD
jgi:hypothetical protein